jgi:pimeloyl-ACP methyl ester carboxylesterase
VGGLVLQNPATEGRDVLRHVVPWYARPFVRIDVAPSLLEDSNLRRIAGVRAPTLIAAGGRDRLLPAPMARALHAASPAAYKRLVVVPRGGHNDLSFDAEVQTEYARLVSRVAGAADR